LKKKQFEDQAEKIGLYKSLIEEKDARIRLMETLLSTTKNDPIKDQK